MPVQKAALIFTPEEYDFVIVVFILRVFNVWIVAEPFILQIADES